MFDYEQPDGYLYAEIVKSEPQDDGSVIVYGRPSQDVLDVDDQVADKDWLKRELPEWFKWGNVREMHQMKAVGTAQTLEFDENDDPWVRSKIVDSEAAKKVREGVYKGYSIGIKKPVLQRDREARKGRFVGGKILELSLVDRPAVPTAKFDIVKAAGANEWLDCQSNFVFEDTTKAGNIHDQGEGNSVDFDSMGNPVLQPGHVQSNAAEITVVSMDDRGCVVRMGSEEFFVPYTVTSAGEIDFGEPEPLPQQNRANVGPTTDTPAIKSASQEVDQTNADVTKAVWSTEYVDSLPDSSFAYISPGGTKEDRHLPYKDQDGKVDAAHVRNALARLDQTNIPAEAKAEAKKKLEAAAKEVDIDVDTTNKASAILDAAKAAVEGKAYCSKCQKSVDMGDKMREEDGDGGKHVTYKGSCGHEVRKFIKGDAEKASDPDETKGDTTPPSGMGEGAGNAEDNKGEPPANGENEAGDQPTSVSDEEKAKEDAEKGATADMKSLIADAVKAALAEVGILPDTAKAGRKIRGERLSRLKDTHAKLGDLIDELDDKDEDEANKAASDRLNGGPTPVDRKDIYEKIREGVSEFEQLARLLTSSESDLVHEGGAPGNLGPDNKAVPTQSKPGGDNMDFTRGDGGHAPSGQGRDVVKADDIADAVKGALADVTKTFGDQLNGVLQPIAQRLSAIEHQANNTTKAQVYVAEHPEVFGQSAPVVKAAAVDEVRQKYSEMTPKQQEEFTQRLVAAARQPRR